MRQRGAGAQHPAIGSRRWQVWEEELLAPLLIQEPDTITFIACEELLSSASAGPACGWSDGAASYLRVPARFATELQCPRASPAPTDPCPCCGRAAKVFFLSLAELRRNSYALFTQGRYVSWCGRGQALIWVLVGDGTARQLPILREAS